MMDFSRYIGIPWAAHGRSLEGADCWGLVWLFYRDEFGIELDDYADAYDPACPADTVGELIAAGSSAWCQAPEPRSGDVAVLMRAGHACHACHVGIVAPRRHLLHVESAEAPSAIARIDDAMKRRIAGFYRWRRNVGRSRSI